MEDENIQFLSSSTYHHYQKNVVLPAVSAEFNEVIGKVKENLKLKGTAVILTWEISR
jgi:hypothetical protein